ncbi:UNVERIFIED_CONTAM: hypothetical protein FKN15_030420 [Acipenser sinensis]
MAAADPWEATAAADPWEAMAAADPQEAMAAVDPREATLGGKPLAKKVATGAAGNPLMVVEEEVAGNLRAVVGAASSLLLPPEDGSNGSSPSANWCFSFSSSWRMGQLTTKWPHSPQAMQQFTASRAPLLPFEASFLIHLRRWYGLQVDPVLRGLHLTPIEGLHKKGVFIWAHVRQVRHHVAPPSFNSL